MSALAAPLASPMGSTLKAYPLSTGVLGLLVLNGAPVTVSGSAVKLTRR